MMLPIDTNLLKHRPYHLQAPTKADHHAAQVKSLDAAARQNKLHTLFSKVMATVGAAVTRRARHRAGR